MLSSIPGKHVRWVIPVVLLAVSAYLRLYHIRGYMTFLGDEGRDVLVVYKMLTKFDIPFIGPTASVGGFFLGPLYYYFMAPALLFSGFDPVGPAIMVALFGIATVYLVYLVGTSFFSPFAGIIAALLYALSPLVIAHSRSSWNPNLVPFFALLLIYSLWKSVKTQQLQWFMVVGLSLGAGVQLHYLFTFLFPVVLLFFLIYNKKQGWIGNYSAMAGASVFVLFPFLGFEVKNGFPNTKTLIRYLSEGKDITVGAAVDDRLADITFRLFGRLLYYFPPVEQYYLLEKIVLFWWHAAVLLTLVLSIGYMVLRVWNYPKKHEVLLLIWFAFGIGLFSLYQRAVYDYYLGILFPFPFLMVGALLDTWRKNRYLMPLVIVIVGSLLVLNWKGTPFKAPPNNQLQQAEDVSKEVFEKTEGKPFNFALVTNQNSDHAYRYFFELWGNPPVTIENFDNDPERQTVTDQLFVICEISPCAPLGHPLWEIAGFGPADISGEWQVGPLKVVKLVHYTP